MRRLLLLIVLLLSTSFFSFTQTEKEIDQYWEYANELVNKGDFHDAITVINEIIESPTKRDLSPVYNTRAKIYITLNNYELALNDTKHVLSLNKKDTTACENLINIRLYSYKYEVLIKESDEALSLIGENFNIRWARGLAFANLNNTQAAIQELTIAIKTNPTSEIGYSIRAKVYWSIEQLSKAITDYKIAYQILPEFNTARDLANIHSGIKDTITSIYYYKEALKFEKDEDCLYYLASKLFDKKDYSKSIKYLDTLITIIYTKPIYFNLRAHAYYNLGNLEKTIENYNLAINTGNSNSVTYSNRAYLYWFTIDNYTEAKQDLLMSITLNDSNDFAWNNLSYANYKLGLLDEALSSSNRAIQLNYDNSYIFKNLALIHYAKKNKELAIINANKAIELGYPLKEDEEFLELLKKLKVKYD